MKKNHGILVVASISALAFASPVFAAEIPFDSAVESNVDSNYEILPEELIGTASFITPDANVQQTRPAQPDTAIPDTQPATPYTPPDTQPARPGRPARPNRPGRPGVNRPASPGNANSQSNAGILDPSTGRTRALLKAAAVPGQIDVYYVRAGDTLWKISRKYMTVLENVIRANPSLSNPDLIYPGDQIAVPLR